MLLRVQCSTNCPQRGGGRRGVRDRSTCGVWHGNKFLDPVNDGAVLPILHLNGWKIANPTLPARINRYELEALLTGYGHEVFTVEGDDPQVLHQVMAATVDAALAQIRDIQRAAREDGDRERRPWPLILMVTPKGWTGPKVIDGLPYEGTWR
jgi:xylulose-5-phosphate/fructose-6-phosphate phosphoketolase